MRKNSKKAIARKPNMSKSSPIIIIGFLSIILVGAFLLCLPISNREGKWLNFVDAFFTSTSAVCVTGLQVFESNVVFNVFGQLVILMLIQIGGIGFMTGATIIFMAIGKKITLHERLALQESISHYNLQGLVSVVQKSLVYILSIECFGAFVLAFTFIPEYGLASGLFKSFFLSISAFCNAGFDVLGTPELLGTSLARYASNGAVLIPIMILVVLGGLGFVVVTELFTHKKNKKITLHSKVVLLMSLVMIFFGAGFFLAFEWSNTFKSMSVGDKIMNAFFQSITPRTAGFSVVNQGEVSTPSSLLTLLYMFIGASPASTGGGIKTTTIFVLFFVTMANLRGNKNITINKNNINENMVRKAVSVVILALTVVFGATFLIAMIELGSSQKEIMTLENILFESISAFATVGLSKGITQNLHWASELVLCVAMFVGRVGALTMGTAFVKSLRNQNLVKYTDAKILIG